MVMCRLVGCPRRAGSLDRFATDGPGDIQWGGQGWWHGAAVGGSPSAQFCCRGPAQVCQALLVRRSLGWYRGDGSPVARGCEPATAAGAPGRARLVSPPAASLRGRLRPEVTSFSRDTHGGQEFVKKIKVLTSGKLTGHNKFSAKVKDYVALLRSLSTS